MYKIQSIKKTREKERKYNREEMDMVINKFERVLNLKYIVTIVNDKSERKAEINYCRM